MAHATILRTEPLASAASLRARPRAACPLLSPRPRPWAPPPFPYPTLFRSVDDTVTAAGRHGRVAGIPHRDVVVDDAVGDPGHQHAAEAILMRREDRKSTRLNSSHLVISYAVFCLTKQNGARDNPEDGAARLCGFATRAPARCLPIALAPPATVGPPTLSLPDALPIC